MILSPLELLRYQRQIILPEIGTSGQEKLKNARVLVVGAGGLGCPILTYLSSAGVGSITIIDSDNVEYSNLHRQTLFKESSIGQPKALEAVRTLEAFNPHVKLYPINDRLSSKNIRQIFSDVDIIVDGSDNFATKYLLNDGCVELGKVLISGSIFCFEGHIAVYNALLGDGDNTRGASYRCLFPEPPPSALIPSCEEAGVLGVLPGIIGTLQATEVVKNILGIGQTLHNRLLIFDALTMTFSEVHLSRNHDLCAKTFIRDEQYYESMFYHCGTSQSQSSITPLQLKEQLSSQTPPYLIDLRDINEKREFDLGGISLSSNTIIEYCDKIPKDRPVVLYCKTGVRSEKILRVLTSQYGFTNLKHLEGGIYAWISTHIGTG